MCRKIIPRVALILWSFCSGTFAQKPTVSISLPTEGMLIRANMPVFGAVSMPKGKEGAFKGWVLDYGAGVNPKTWTTLAVSGQLLKEDPWAAGKIFWDPNKEPKGNLTNWAVGWGYLDKSWRDNLNGLYTLRLTAMNKKGDKVEMLRTLYVGG